MGAYFSEQSGRLFRCLIGITVFSLLKFQVLTSSSSAYSSKSASNYDTVFSGSLLASKDSSTASGGSHFYVCFLRMAELLFRCCISITNEFAILKIRFLDAKQETTSQTRKVI